ncbi:TATA-box-binding protein [Halorubrum ezzemoulense]|jgi:transcription initiation factor TFIID TATA-box-binding protein|uniref:TATA-box-binding protein n=1 Tax=Halorubrum salinarum TaxID=2739057 RepID=A0A7D4CUU1_9EURY|nr:MULTISPECIES: TATA-box-binding protein [Halobacteria]TKX85408.1 TATA-box-binding protein [Halorubrum sp. SS5]MCD2200676.1 TATA-box-binding protein [Halobacterium sp. KA-4]MDB9234691.1 TATA-box-binding protein [Halorubrum ezzemoulense]MDB9250173.1 TATA-box-binding protein [Halorubrum ezzemoulense]MDB9260449.1 TATA-box-binding protein [Halorubrum ezzemoulense]
MSVTAESIQVENVVASSDIGQELDLETLSEDLGATDYDPDNFPGLVYRMHDPKAAALIFRSGKVVCTGAKSVDNVTTALEYVFDELRELGVDVATTPDIEIQNIVSSGDLDHTLNLNAIAIGLGLEHIEYEPEQFPGLVYRLDDPDVVALLFGSGKLVITGGKQLDDAEQALTVIENRLTDLGLLE